jgi:hypothetical protein
LLPSHWRSLKLLPSSLGQKVFESETATERVPPLFVNKFYPALSHLNKFYFRQGAFSYPTSTSERTASASPELSSSVVYQIVLVKKEKERVPALPLFSLPLCPCCQRFGSFTVAGRSLSNPISNQKKKQPKATSQTGNSLLFP